jgi:alkylation response protein AidB-like acyl-CoA dehydrogenase
MSSGSDTGPSAFSSESLGRAAEEAAELAREHAGAIERERRLPEGLVTRLRVSGLMRAGAPSSLGAPQAPAAVTLRCAETVARGDASAGWCVSIAAISSLLSAYLPPDGTAEIFGDPQTVAAGVWAPRGTACPVDGGFRVSGRWAYCSGITHSDYLFAGTVVQADSKPEVSEPVLRVVAIPTDELQIIDTWHTTGLRGTGSHDAIADEVFVPDRRTLSLLDAVHVDAPLYRFPIFGFFALSIAAAALGNARGAIDELAQLAADKVGQDSTRTLAQRPATQAAVAQAESSLRAARAFYYQAIDDAWRAAHCPEPVPVRLRTALRLAATHAVRTAAEITRSMYDLGRLSVLAATSCTQPASLAICATVRSYRGSIALSTRASTALNSTTPAGSGAGVSAAEVSIWRGSWSMAFTLRSARRSARPAVVRPPARRAGRVAL